MQQVPEPHLEHRLSTEEFSRRYKVLLHAAEIAARRDFPELLQELSRLLHELFDFNSLNYALHDHNADVMRAYMMDEQLRLSQNAVEFSIEGSPAGWVWSHQIPLVLSDLNSEERFESALDVYREKGFRSLIVLPITTARRQLGTLCFGSRQAVHCDADALHFLERLAGLVALALENSLFLELSFAKESAAAEQQQLRELAEARLQLSRQSAAGYANLRRERERLETIVEIQSALAASGLELHEMFSSISKSLQKAIAHDVAVVSLWDPDEQSLEVYATEPGAHKELWRRGDKFKNQQTFTSHILTRAKDGKILGRREMEAEAAHFENIQKASAAGLVSWCILPMRAPNRLVGVLYVGSRREDAFTDRDLDLLRHLASTIGLYIENAQSRSAVEIEKDRLNLLLEISRTLTSTLDWTKLFQDISTCIRRLMAEDYAHVALYEPANDIMRIRALDFPGGHGLITSDIALRPPECPTGIAFQARETKIFGQAELEQIGSEFTKKMLKEGILAVCCVPLIARGQALGTIGIASTKHSSFEKTEVELLQQLAPQIAIAIDNSRTYQEISALKDRLTKEKLYLEQEIRDTLNFEEIVGQSPALTSVLEQVKTVASSTATVLILGETGTGKELIARAIHKLSPRAAGNFVKVNCAAIPTGLLESELFGHEKGAFTGAVTQKIGRLELADKGTLLLDEVGEIPLELQPKLLRVLQDQEFERLGGTRTIRVNVRVLAATNRDLSNAVAEHDFRADLYYRLHVFPIRLPPLRDRPGDITLLALHFMQKFARRMNKPIECISQDSMLALEQWHWPGNIRELENFIERSVILTEGVILRVPVGELTDKREKSSSAETMDTSTLTRSTLEELERQYIVRVLQRAGGVVSGSRGAAALLGMKRTTLQSKIQRLKIQRQEYGC